jgi:hypothetical protein
MFIQLPDLEGHPNWFNSDYIVSIHPAGHDAAKTVLTFHDGTSITVDRECQKVMVQITASDRPQFPFPALPARIRPEKRHHASLAERIAANPRHHQRPVLVPPAAAK